VEVIHFIEEMAEGHIWLIIDDLGSIEITSSAGKIVRKNITLTYCKINLVKIFRFVRFEG